MRNPDARRAATKVSITMATAPMVTMAGPRTRLGTLMPKAVPAALSSQIFFIVDGARIRGAKSSDSTQRLHAGEASRHMPAAILEPEIGRAHVCTQVTTAHLVSSLLLEKTHS